ncbi:MAG: hypothetical protein Harvfovirus64_2 [Harvfovirus sp.]|uniref:PH domain-containing protein n=1 Tax=Harvfovirus sp. TaxID=2487768 RepID=A0A3G5A3K3_9VIRU|nr:MAG: hypothetical protein Harvfovirus64_2 [Harvfovirus sp.]
MLQKIEKVTYCHALNNFHLYNFAMDSALLDVQAHSSEDITEIPTKHVCRETKESITAVVKKDWKRIMIKETMPYFGWFIHLMVTSRNPADQINFHVEPAIPNAKSSIEPKIIEWRKEHIGTILIMKMRKWPIFPPCDSCPWKDKLLYKTCYAGFFVKANAFAYSFLSNPYGCHNNTNCPMPPIYAAQSDLAVLMKVRKSNIFLFYAEDNTPAGSLYWTDEASEKVHSFMPLNTITKVFVGRSGNFFPKITNSGILSRETITNSCLSVETDTGFSLNLDFHASKQRKLWEETLALLLIKHGRRCINKFEKQS